MSKIVQKGNKVSVNYTGKFEDGQVFDSSEGRAPLEFVVGGNQVIPAFESCLIGKEAGYKTTIKISADNAYGQPKPELIIKVPIAQVPAGVQVGQTLHAMAESQQIAVVVKEVNSDSVLIDGNHPLAGKDLLFDIEVVDINS